MEENRPSLASILCSKVSDANHSFKLGGRWGDREVTVRPMSTGDILEYERTSMVRMAGVKGTTHDPRKHLKSIIANHLVDPSPKNLDVLKEVGAQSQDEFIFEYFRNDELTRIVEEIKAISGIDNEISDVEEYAKKQ